MKPTPVIRIRVLLACIFLFGLVLVGKLYDLQIVNGAAYSQKADRQYVKPNSVIFSRGSIFFQERDGTKVAVATVEQGFTLAMNPRLLTDPEAAYAAIASVFAHATSSADGSPEPVLDHAAFLADAADKSEVYIEVIKKVDTADGLAIGALNIPGISVYQNDWRYYPGGSMASQIIGLTGEDSTESAPVVSGRYGLEDFYDSTLARNVDALYVNFFAELFANIKSTVFENQPLEGDIVSSIDPTVQNFLEQTLIQTEATWHPDEIGGIIIDPNTGEIYGMAHFPTFDPNDTTGVTNPALFSDPMVQSTYEMGSIIKPLTMAAGLDSGSITPTETYDDMGCIIVNTGKICNYDSKARGVIPMQQVLSQSLNVGASFIATAMGTTTQTRYFQSFGLGSTTGVDLPNDQRGNIANLFVNRQLEHDTAAFGQGIAMTPLATARALSILANGGLLITPHVVNEIDYTVGVPKTIAPPAGVRVVSQQTAQEVTDMLIQVVDKAFAKGPIQMAHYSIAAKTGTAQIANPAGGGYYTDRYLHSFFGYFPASKPRFLIFLYQVYPKGAEYASATLTNPFQLLTHFLINYYDIPPDR
jgi:cell division protein FtsI/penicillin-binding protein 2